MKPAHSYMVIALLSAVFYFGCADEEEPTTPGIPIFEDLLKINLYQPGDGATGVSRTTAHFKYSSPGGVALYIIFISNSPLVVSGHTITNPEVVEAGIETTLNDILITDILTLTGSTFSGTYTFSALTQYYWAVVGYDSGDQVIASSPQWSFTTN